MIQLAYVSSAVELFSAETIERLLKDCRRRNQQRNISGMLLYRGGNILQVIEGQSDMVLPLYAKIARDPRHHGVIKFYQKPIQERDFPDWTMAFHDLEAPQARHVEGYSDFLTTDEGALAVHSAAAVKLVKLFKASMR